MKREPDIKGQFAEAWQCKLEPKNEDQTATLVAYIIKMPDAHPFWDHWFIAMIHLRDIPGARPATKKYPEAEYELIIYALDPRKNPVEIDPDNLPDPMPMLHPVDVVVQFDCSGMDEAARKIVVLAIQCMTRGHASPDQDYRSFWERTIQETARHYREGKHGVG